MMTEILVPVLLLIGSLFMLLAAVGILRMPDCYMRIGTSTKASTLGLVCILAAVAVHFAEIGMGTRAIAAIVFVFLTAPIAAHMIGRAAYVVGVPLWDRTIVDELRGRYDRQPPQPSSGPDKESPRQPNDGRRDAAGDAADLRNAVSTPGVPSPISSQRPVK